MAYRKVVSGLAKQSALEAARGNVVAEHNVNLRFRPTAERVSPDQATGWFLASCGIAPRESCAIRRVDAGTPSLFAALRHQLPDGVDGRCGAPIVPPRASSTYVGLPSAAGPADLHLWREAALSLSLSPAIWAVDGRFGAAGGSCSVRVVADNAATALLASFLLHPPADSAAPSAAPDAVLLVPAGYTFLPEAVAKQLGAPLPRHLGIAAPHFGVFAGAAAAPFAGTTVGGVRAAIAGTLSAHSLIGAIARCAAAALAPKGAVVVPGAVLMPVRGVRANPLVLAGEYPPIVPASAISLEPDGLPERYFPLGGGYAVITPTLAVGGLRATLAEGAGRVVGAEWEEAASCAAAAAATAVVEPPPVALPPNAAAATADVEVCGGAKALGEVVAKAFGGFGAAGAALEAAAKAVRSVGVRAATVQDALDAELAPRAAAAPKRS